MRHVASYPASNVPDGCLPDPGDSPADDFPQDTEAEIHNAIVDALALEDGSPEGLVKLDDNGTFVSEDIYGRRSLVFCPMFRIDLEAMGATDSPKEAAVEVLAAMKNVLSAAYEQAMGKRYR